MKTLRILYAALLCCISLPAMAAIPADWTTPLAPFHISGNLYWVGSRDLAAYLVTTPQGNILINANLASSPPQIRRATDYDKTLDRFPPAHVDRVLHDGDTVVLGGTTIVAHKTAGHTKGCTTWTLQTREGTRTLNVALCFQEGTASAVPLRLLYG